MRDMRNCPKCGSPVQDGMRFCSACGASMGIMATPAFCPHCGTALPAGSRFCNGCGKGVTAPVAAAAQPKKKGPVIAIWSAAIALVLVLALVVSWSFGLLDEIVDGDPFGSSTVRDDDDDDVEKGESEKPTRPDPSLSTVPPPTNTLPADPAVEEITLTVWAPFEDQIDENSWLPNRLKAFEAAHPEYNITWKLGVCAEGDASHLVTGDVASAADVFMYPNDQMGTLIEAGALTKLGGSYLEQVMDDNARTVIDTVTYTDGCVYGFPYSNNTWFMYYDKSVYTQEDVKSLETMLEKGRVSFPVSNAWYNWSFYAAGGGTLFGPVGMDASAGIQLGANGADVTRYLVDFVNHPNFVSSEIGAEPLLDGYADAGFSGSWDAAAVADVLGDNMGVAPLPTININGEVRQLRSFAGSKAIGVNRYSRNMKVALEVAAFLSSAESQLLHYEFRGVIPSTSRLVLDPVITADQIAMAEMNTMQYTACIQPMLPEMGRYWTPAVNMGTAIVNGEITEDNADEQTELFQQALNGAGL